MRLRWRRRRQTLTVRGTRKDAERKLAELVHQVDSGGYIKPAAITVGQFLERWLEEYACSHVRGSTLEGYRFVVIRHLSPALGKIPLRDLNANHLQAYYAEKQTKGKLTGEGGLSARSVLSHHRVLHEALSHAIRWGLLGRNVAEGATPPRPRKKEMLTLNSDEVLRLMGASKGTPYHALFHLALYTGMRRSELLGLRWKDVDLDMATLSVVQILHCSRAGQVVFQEPKTVKSRRMVALSPSAVLALRIHRERQAAERVLIGVPLTGDSLVFSRADGSPDAAQQRDARFHQAGASCRPR